MKILQNVYGVLILSGMLVIAGCGNDSNGSTQIIGATAVIDLDRIATATGRGGLIAEEVLAFTQSEETKLNNLKDTYVADIAAARAALGENPSEEDSQAVIILVQQSEANLQRGLSQARAASERLKVKLILDFRNEVQPIARQIAESNGFSLVVIASPELLYIKPDSDITNLVVDSVLATAATGVVQVAPAAENN